MSIDSLHIDRLLEPFVECFSPDVAARIANLKADAATQQRVDYLADRANEGLLTQEERDEYEGYLQAARIIAILQAKARAVAHGDH